MWSRSARLPESALCCVQKDNVPFAAAIDTMSALMGSIAESLDLYTVEPSNSTKTVLIPLRFAPDPHERL